MQQRQGRFLVWLILFLGLTWVSSLSSTVLAQTTPVPPSTPPAQNAASFSTDTTNLPSSPPPQKFGIATHPWWLDWYLDKFVAYFKDLRITTVRLPIEWKTLEPTPGNYDWALNDRLLTRLQQEGFSVVGEFVTVPLWASSNPAICATSDLLCTPDPQYRPNLSQLTTELTKRYPFVRHWEFWNEPDWWPNFGMDNISRYSDWLLTFYDAAKAVDSTLLIAATSLSGPEYTDWLYNHCDAIFGRRPFDAIAYHPYTGVRLKPSDPLPADSIRENEVEELRRLMVKKGDAHKPIWLTEIGWEASPEQQSALLKDAFDFTAARDYITLVHVHMLHDWDAEFYGLLKTREIVYWQRPLKKTDDFEPKQPYYDSFKFYDKRPLSLRPLALPTRLVFPETGHTVQGVFAKAFERGKVSLFGLPKTGQFWELNPADGHYYLVQYFERVRMEYHPEYKGTRYEILFGLLGKQLLTEKGWFDQTGRPLRPEVTPQKSPVHILNGQRWFAETSQLVESYFLKEWERQGGLEIIGLPLSQVFEERNPDDGQLYAVQYFERARAELHVAKDGTRYVAFGLLGNDVLRAQERILANNQPDFSNYYNPALPEFR